MNDLADRRQEEKERRRAEILDAAEAVATKAGWDEMTMNMVARKARVSRPLLYVYFADKTDLMFGVAERALLELRRRFLAAAAREQRGIDQVRSIGRAYIAFSREHPFYFAILTRCEMRSPGGSGAQTNEDRSMARGDELHSVLENALQAGVRDGSIRPDLGDVRVISVALWGFMHGVISLAASKANVLAHRGIVIDRLMELALTMATRSVAAEGVAFAPAQE